MKKKHIKITVLISFVILLLLIAGIFLSAKKEGSEKVKLGNATLPTVTMEVAGIPVNTLFGYAEEMDIPFVRDTITPVDVNGKLNITVENTDEVETEVKFEILSLDGETVIGSGTASQSEQYILDLKKSLSDNTEAREAVLKIILVQGEKTTYYYTRITDGSELNAGKCLEFAKEFQTNTFDKNQKEEIVKYLEPDYEKSNNTFENVDIHSNIYHVTWGNMEPEISGNITWDIKESNTVYTSFVSEYQVKIKEEDKGTETFNIREYYRVRFLNDKLYLLNFDRSMEQVFDPTGQVLSKDGIIIGIASPDMEYDGSSDGRYTAFVQERVLWIYDRTDREFTFVFGFADNDDTDIRNKNEQHSIRIIDVDKEGNVTFTVSGYMNRGRNEGRTGVAVCYYKNAENVVEEKAFMADTRSGGLASLHLGQMIYYSPSLDTINYVMNNMLYSLKAGDKEPKILLQDIPDKDYKISEDGQLFVCKTPGNEESLTVFDFNTGETRKIDAPEGKFIKTLGFIKNDIIYGISDTAEEIEIETAEKVLPIEKIEIRDQNNDVVKEYMAPGMIITGISTKDNLITVQRASYDGYTYKAEKEDYISNNEENKSKEVRPDTFYTEFQETQIFLSFKEEDPDSQPGVKYPEYIFKDNIIPSDNKEDTTEKEYYVYGKGLPPESYKDPSDAILRARKLAGVVVDENQKYIWEKGNRDLAYFNKVEEITVDGGKSPLQICEEILATFPGTKTRLNGIEFTDLCYIISSGSPAIARTGESEVVLITGYNLDNVEYLDPSDGKLHYEPVKKMEEKLKENGNMFEVNL